MKTLKAYWCECLRCTYVWLAHFSDDEGSLFAASEHGEDCPECGTTDFEIGEEYTKGSEL